MIVRDALTVRSPFYFNHIQCHPAIPFPTGLLPLLYGLRGGRLVGEALSHYNTILTLN